MVVGRWEYTNRKRETENVVEKADNFRSEVNG